MATPPQPPPTPDSWAEPSAHPGGFANGWGKNPQDGYTGPTAAAGMTSVKRRLGLAIAAAVLMLAAGGFFVVHSAGSKQKGYVTLPVRLLGLSQDTSVMGELLVNKLKRAELRSNRGELTGVVAAVYGPLFGSFMVSGGGLCGSCLPVSASQLKSG